MPKKNTVEDGNPILEIYRGKPIRLHNIIPLRVDQRIYKKILDIQFETKLSIRQILSYSGTPCERCQMQPVTAFTETGPVKVDRGILSKGIPKSKKNQINPGDKGRKVIDNNTGEIYESISEVAKLFSLNYPALVDKLNGRYNNNTTFRFYEQNIDVCKNNK